MPNKIAITKALINTRAKLGGAVTLGLGSSDGIS